ncbi:MAG: hypothetical protein ACR2JW_14785, partial [Thermomicrobiales bacterium]
YAQGVGHGVAPSLRSRQPEKNHTMTVFVNDDATYTHLGTLPSADRTCFTLLRIAASRFSRFVIWI